MFFKKKNSWLHIFSKILSLIPTYFGFFIIGRTAAEKYYTPSARIDLPFLVFGVILLGIGLFSFYKIDKMQKKSFKNDFMKFVCSFAKTKGGAISAMDISLVSDVPLDHIVGILKEIQKLGFASPESDNSGGIIYYFKDFV